MKNDQNLSRDLSLVIPVYNEEESLPKLVQEIHTALDPTDLDYEMVFVDDGSRDGSFAILEALHKEDNRVVVVSFRRNFGQTAGFKAGFSQAQGKVVVTLDADGQNPPADIPKLVAKLDEGDGYDVVNGWRENRQDGWLLRKVPSKIANNLIARSTGVRLRDRGCSLRAFRHYVLDDLKLYGEMHRFIPELVNNAGFTMAEVSVDHRSREAGTSKYGISRTFRVIVDLMTVLFLRNYADRPMHLFGAIGITSGLGGVLIGLILSVQKIWAGISKGWDGFEAFQIGNRPILLLAVMLIILGAQFLIMGLLGELLVRTYYETQNKPVYQVRTVLEQATSHH